MESQSDLLVENWLFDFKYLGLDLASLSSRYLSISDIPSAYGLNLPWNSSKTVPYTSILLVFDLEVLSVPVLMFLLLFLKQIWSYSLKYSFCSSLSSRLRVFRFKTAMSLRWKLNFFLYCSKCFGSRAFSMKRDLSIRSSFICCWISGFFRITFTFSGTLIYKNGVKSDESNL